MAKNWALVIGINGYNPLNFSPLRYAKRDAEQVKALFEEVGFDQVCLFTDDSPPLEIEGFSIPTQPTYGNLISFFEDRFKNPFLSTGDNCWFFFAGHGERHGDKDYLMPMDANSRGTKAIAGLQVDEVREWLTRSGADNVILLLDACRNEGKRGTQGIDPSEQKGVITISSCNPTQVAWEIEELQHGAFTYALLEALRLPGERSCATVERLGTYIRDRVPKLCQHYGKVPPQLPRIHVDPLEKQHFILMPQFARQADIDLMKKEGFRLAFEGKVQLAEQMFIRANAAARGLDAEIIQALRRIFRMDGTGVTQPETVQHPDQPSSNRSRTSDTLSIKDVATDNITPPQPSTPERLSPSTSPQENLSSRLTSSGPSAGQSQPPQKAITPPRNPVEKPTPPSAASRTTEPPQPQSAPPATPVARPAPISSQPISAGAPSAQAVRTRPTSSPSRPTGSQGSRRKFLWLLGLGGVGTVTAIMVGSLPKVDYSRLEELLKAGDWKGADQETLNLMLQVTNRTEQGWLDLESLQNFPCEVLSRLDDLWLKYSDGKFGFSVQQQIWEEVGSPTEYNAQWEEFGDRVGWRKDGEWLSYSDLNPNLESSPKGIFPFGGWGVVFGGGVFSRAAVCKL